MDAAFTFMQILYWLALSTWFGGLLFVAVAAPVIFRTIHESDPTLPTVLSVNLEGQHGTLLAGSIVANLLSTLLRFQLVCAAILALGLIVQWVALYDTQVWPLVLRTALYIGALVLLGYDWRVVSPRIFQHRQEYIDHADEPEIANVARVQFDRYHRESITVLMIELGLLMGIILFSAGISPPHRSAHLDNATSVGSHR
ncbi:MAG TPA: DUF4149 domain-containing protein [Tepidisphaeraceae bacterium]|nr:DUF4149 domain-containing protein [Tepidisphaeraceae bacterium]